MLLQRPNSPLFDGPPPEELVALETNLQKCSPSENRLTLGGPTDVRGFEAFSADRKWRLEQDFFHSNWAQERRQLSEAMLLAGIDIEKVDRFENCGKDASVWRNTETGKRCIRSFKCHNRHCQVCAKTSSLRVADNVGETIEYDRRHFSMLVLTLKHNDATLGTQIDRLYKAFSTLRKKPLWKRSVRGGSVFFQNHQGRDGKWHPHLHIILWHLYMPHWWLKDQWLQITGDSDRVHIARVKDPKRAARDVARYVSRPLGKHGVVTDPYKLAEVIAATHGRHLCYIFGVWPGPRLHEKRAVDEPGAWVFESFVADVIHRAQCGDEASKRILEELRGESSPERGPPPQTVP